MLEVATMSHGSAIRRRGAFTLVEMLVTVLLISVVAAIVTPMILRSRARSKALRCLANQRQISESLLCFYQDHGIFPSDDPDTDLAFELRQYIRWSENAADKALPEVWRCPNDRGPKVSNSYQPYYVQPHNLPGSDDFVLGCPRHDGIEDGFVLTRGIGSTSALEAGTVKLNGVEVRQEASTEERGIREGTMSFQDGSTVTIVTPGPDHRVSAVASFRMENGKLYTIVRIQGDGETAFNVTPGSRFQVITPVALIGVRGTQFIVRNQFDRTTIHLESGVIEVTDRPRHLTHKMSPGDSLEITMPPAPRKLIITYVNAGKWRVENPNDFDIWFWWYDMPDGEYGDGQVSAHKKVTISTPLNPSHEAIEIYYELRGAGLVSDTASVNSADT